MNHNKQIQTLSNKHLLTLIMLYPNIFVWLLFAY